MNQPSVLRLVKYVNWAIAILAGIALVLFYRYAWRPLAQYSGDVRAPIAAAATASFDSLGVPHIRAASQEDALFVQGYVTAQERIFQMDLLRRFNAGELAEVFGAAALETDRDSRRLRLRRLAELAYPVLPAADRAAFAAYTRGVNAYIASHLSRLPLEFTVAGYQPRPWSVIDSLVVCLYMFRDLTTTWKEEIVKRNMLAAGDRAKVNALFPVNTAMDVRPGSNGWALSGAHTASGKPILSNDMHLAYSLPGIWYMAHLQAPGMDVSGVTLPGAPGVIVGHNQRIAWGITNLQFDVQDLYIEKFNDRTGQYEFGGKVEQAAAERELIRVKGQAPVEMVSWITRHGPLFVTEGSDRMALKWSVAEPGLVQYPMLDIARARNWDEFTSALRRFGGPGSNFVYADVDGNIGYHAAGKLPVRRGYSGDVPVDGASGNFEWQGWIPFDELPAVYNPPSGIIVTANQNPFPARYPYPVNGNFASPYRARQIRTLLSGREKWRPEDLLAVQKDVYSAFDRFLAGQLVAAYERRGAHSARLDAAVAMLRNWNGQMDKDLAAPFLATVAYQHLAKSFEEMAAPGNTAGYDQPLAPAVIEHLLRERPADWCSDYDSLLLRALVDAVDEGSRIQGRDLSRWRYGNSLRVRINHPVIHQIPVFGAGIPLFGPRFDIGPVPMSGGRTTVKQTTQTLGPSMRMNADLANWDNSLLNIVTGQAGQILARHYTDEWKAYYTGRSFPMQFQQVDAKSTLRFVP